MLIQQIARFVEPWHTMYSESKVLPTVTLSVHILALLFGGGLAVAADRATLRLVHRDDAARRLQLIELRDVHRPVLIALACSLVSGIALAAADVETFAVAPMFWVKLSLVALLLVNGLWLATTERRLRQWPESAQDAAGRTAAPLWATLRFNSVCSLTLWSLTLVAGVTLANVT